MHRVGGTHDTVRGAGADGRTTVGSFAALRVVSFVLVWRLVPETKGSSLEAIQERWVVGGDKMLDEETA